MKKIIKITAIILLVALIVIQFIRPAKNNNPAITANDITNTFQINDTIKNILSRACYDCHSNNTTYPWYSNMQPVAWWLNDHIEEGKHHLNFSEFGSYPLLRQSKKLKETANEIDEGEMPLSSYTLIHRNAVLTHDEKEMMMNWAKNLSAEIYAKVPPEEIEKDKKRREERKRQQEAGK